MADIGPKGPVDNWLSNLGKVSVPKNTPTGRGASVVPTAADKAKTAGIYYDLFTAKNQQTPAGRAAAVANANKTAQSTSKPTGMASTLDAYKYQQQMAASQAAAKTAAGAANTGGKITPLTSQIAKTITPAPFTADMLYQDATSAYQPLMDMYNKQQASLQDRYATNAADIKNIFGNLTTVRAQDKAKIAQQFKTSIEQQQNALAARTAESRQGVAAGQQGAATAAGEMGTAGQPVPTSSLTAQAAEQGIADSNAYQTTWSALQNVMSQQAQNDVQNAVQGYDYQQTSALETLRNNLEDRLAAIQGNMAGTQSDIAQANFGSKQNVLNAKYSEAQQAQAQAAALAQAQASASAEKSPSYSKGMFGLQKQSADAGVNFTDIQSSVRDAFDSAYAALNPTGSTKVTTPKKADILNAWNQIKSGSPQSANQLAPYVNAYVGYTFKN
jgi:hypothetical protein